MSMSKYGMTWPDGTDELAMHRWIYLNDKDQYRRFCHMKAGCKLLIPEYDTEGNPGWIWSYWTDRRGFQWCSPVSINRMTWIGPSSSGKTTDSAGFAVWDFLCDPEHTSIRIATNTLECLEDRTWSEVVRFWNLLPAKPANCNFIPSDMRIECGPKGYIKGIAVKQGTEEQAMASIKGAHSPRVRVICDELDSMPIGTIKAIKNAEAGCKSFIFVGTGNPVRRLSNPLGIMCTPKSGKWSDASVTMEQWETKYGICMFFDGRKSPGVLEPKKFGDFLLNKAAIDDCAATEGEYSPVFWSQRIGFFPPEGVSFAIIDEPMLQQFKMMENVTWTSAFTKGIAYDPSYSAGGDRCMVRVFAVGSIADSASTTWVSLKTIQVKMELKADVSLSDTIGNAVAQIAEVESVDPNCIAADCTGNQGAVTDVVEQHVGKGILRIQYGGAAGTNTLDKTVNATIRSGRRAFQNKRAEMYYAFRMFARSGQIRNLDMDTASELTQVEWKKTNMPMLVEDKDEVRKRIGQSPDNGDTAVMGLDLARYRMGLKLAGVAAATKTRRQVYNDVDNSGEFCKDDWQVEPSTSEV